MAHGAAQAVGAGTPGDLWSIATASEPSAWIIRPVSGFAAPMKMTFMIAYSLEKA